MSSQNEQQPVKIKIEGTMTQRPNKSLVVKTNIRAGAIAHVAPPKAWRT